jgi:hypothetical protein
MKTKKLFILTKDGGDGSTYPQFTFDEKLINLLEQLHNDDILDYENGFSDGDGFHYETLTVPEECTQETLGIRYLLDGEYYFNEYASQLEEDE